MKKVTKELLKTAANNLMFDMPDDQYDTLLEEFTTITSQMEIVGNIKGVDDAEPMTFPYDLHSTYLREDVATNPIDRDVILKNASDIVDGQIRLPKVIK